MDSPVTDALIAGIYSAAAGRQSWEPVLDAMNTHCESWAVQLIGVDKRNGAALFSHYGGVAPPEAHLAYLRTYQWIDPRAPLVFVPPVKDWFHCHEHISDEQVAASPFYQDFLIPVGARYASAMPIVNDNDMAVMLVVLRAVGRPPLEAATLGWLDRLRRHMVEGMAIYRHLSALHAESTAGQAILNRMTHPVLLVDAAHSLRYANAAGRTALDDKAVIRTLNGRLHCMDASDDVALNKALGEMVIAAPAPEAPARRFLRLRGTSARQKFGISLSVLNPTETRGAFGLLPLAMLVLHDGQQDVECDPFVIQELFGLTPAEADVGVRLCQGASPETIARQRGVALNTVRSQLRALLAKTGTARQGDLLRRLLTFPHGIDGA